ncbi:hypothetical protein [Novacetimonas maltaceti]|uniref:Tannase/feruloyl esterase family alpha/beta hydrolase n=1 Tax=Novacetimonas maltaceti TaxID=1203393 RepID=A0A2S3W146_9PROT|nr:hypothetical protein [Novacetimonas maltaceti]POF62273.1 hypothetical protein KMAL_21310 [Novacetimonas maltaceti]
MPHSKPTSTSVRGLPRQTSRLAIGMALAMPLALASVTAAHAADCRDLARRALPDATFTTVETVPAGRWQPPQDQLSRIMSAPGMNLAGHAVQSPTPAFCRVALTLRPSHDSQIRTEVWLPLEGWNGKLEGSKNP